MNLGVNMRLVCLVSLFLMLSACSSEPEPKTITQNYQSIQQCVEDIKFKTGKPLNPMTDEQNHVSGLS